MKTGLVLEGGALRAIFSSGVCDGLLEGGIMTDYFIGVSAGAAYGVSYLSRQPRRNLEVVTRFAPDRRYMGMRNLADKKNQSYFGLEFSYQTIPNELVPFDYDAFQAYPGKAEAVVTNLNTGGADYLEIPRQDREELFRAEREGRLLVIAPRSTLGVSRTERNTEKLRLLWAAGYQDAVDRLEEIQDFFSR